MSSRDFGLEYIVNTNGQVHIPIVHTPERNRAGFIYINEGALNMKKHQPG